MVGSGRSNADMTARDVTSENGPLVNAEETSMTIYISQGRYTAAAIKGMSARPEDRSEAVAELFAAAGAQLNQLVSDFGTLRLADHSGSTG